MAARKARTANTNATGSTGRKSAPREKARPKHARGPQPENIPARQPAFDAQGADTQRVQPEPPAEPTVDTHLQPRKG